MKILILGAGQVGYSLAETLVSEKNDITVIEVVPERVKALQDTFDLRAIEGNASSPNTLKLAGAEDTDLLIAATQSDDTNLVACKICAQLFNIPTRIARIASSDYLIPELTDDTGFSITHSICPEQVVSDYITRLVEIPEALQVLDFAGGKLSLVAVRVSQHGALVGHAVKDLPLRVDIPSAVAAIFRPSQSGQNQLILPNPDTLIMVDDEVFLLAATKHIRQVVGEMRHINKPVKRIMIAGGGNIGMRLAKTLEKRYDVKIIEQDKARCEKLISELNRTLVLAGNSTNADMLDSENISEMDMFISVTNDDEGNIMSSLLAKRMGARRVIALINHKVYADLIQGEQIDIAISPAHVILGSLLAHVRRGDVASVSYLRHGSAEALELVAHGDEQSSKIIGKTLQQIPLPKGASILAIIRKEMVLLAAPDLTIQADDHVLMLVCNRRLIQEIEDLFEVGFRFF